MNAGKNWKKSIFFFFTLLLTIFIKISGKLQRDYRPNEPTTLISDHSQMEFLSGLDFKLPRINYDDCFGAYLESNLT